MSAATPGAAISAPDARLARAGRRLPRIGWAGVTLVGLISMLALAAPWLSPYRVAELAGRPLESPSSSHLVGTNAIGQDLASQLLSGARASLLVAAVAGGATVAFGAAVGMLAGWKGGRVDAVLMRVTDVVLTTPRLPLLIVAGAYAGRDLFTVAMIIAATFWPPVTRVVRAQVMSLRQRAHVTAAVGFGAGTAHVLRLHVLPGIGLILAAELVTAAARAVALESGLAFLGLGDPTRASWGAIMREALGFSGLFYTSAWTWWLVPPVVAVSCLLLGITFLGLALEQRLNPRLVRHRLEGSAW
ncbi:MAG: ABC transporter permease [Actinomycetota bacterium]|nr:ABC transporter permease [Actinomycetota bacterium]MDQ3680662.1 ABC transporter permease [Actinomycetota bacterium]